MPELTELCELARNHGTDKGGWHTKAGDTCHNYTPYYHAMWAARREQVKNVLEVGVHYGSSLRMWRDYFPNARVWGLDCNAACLFTEPRIKCFTADQGSAVSLLQALDDINMYCGQRVLYDFIVDDGSHEEGHQVLTANTLIPYLMPDGLYVIEDIAYDCNPLQYLRQIKYHGIPIPTGIGIGKAHCWDACPLCHGAEGERLLVLSCE